MALDLSFQGSRWKPAFFECMIGEPLQMHFTGIKNGTLKIGMSRFSDCRKGCSFNQERFLWLCKICYLAYVLNSVLSTAVDLPVIARSPHQVRGELSDEAIRLEIATRPLSGRSR